MYLKLGTEISLGETKNPKEARFVQIPLLRLARRSLDITDMNSNPAIFTNRIEHLIVGDPLAKLLLLAPSLFFEFRFCFKNNGLS